MYGAPLAGALWLVKVRLPENYTIGSLCWSGLIGNPVVAPLVGGAATPFIGIRADTVSGAANWFLVCGDGTTETTLDLGVVAGQTWQILGFRRLLDGSIQGLVGDAKSGWRGYIVDVIGTISTHIPTTSLEPTPLGLISWVNEEQKRAQIDFWDLGGPATRQQSPT